MGKLSIKLVKPFFIATVYLDVIMLCECRYRTSFDIRNRLDVCCTADIYSGCAFNKVLEELTTIVDMYSFTPPTDFQTNPSCTYLKKVPDVIVRQNSLRTWFIASANKHCLTPNLKQVVDLELIIRKRTLLIFSLTTGGLGGKIAAVDVSVKSPLRFRSRKLLYNGHTCEALCLPIVVDSFGAWGTEKPKPFPDWILGWLHKPDCARHQFCPTFMTSWAVLLFVPMLAQSSPVVCTVDMCL